MAVETYYNKVYAARELDLDETGNSFVKIAPLWRPTRDAKLAVLDIGCGAGSVSGVLVQEGHEVVGLDIVVEAVERARGRGIDARAHDLNDRLPFADDAFDVVIALDIFEHVFDPRALLGEVKRVLRPNGYAIIMVPLHFDIYQRLRTLLGRGIVHYEHLVYDPTCSPWNYFHLRFLTLREVRAGVAAAGFAIEREEFRPMVLSFRSRIVRLLQAAAIRPRVVEAYPSLLASGVLLRVSANGETASL